MLGVILGSVLLGLGAICRFNTEALLQQKPGKDRTAAYDEARTRRFLRGIGVAFMVLGVALVVLSASKH